MAADTWPATLPQRFFARAPFSYGLKNTNIVVDPETGPARTRPRSTALIYRVSGSVLLDLATNQHTTFINFYHTTLAGGTKLFNWVDPLDPSDTVEMLFVSAGVERLITPVAPSVTVARLDLEMYK